MSESVADHSLKGKRAESRRVEGLFAVKSYPNNDTPSHSPSLEASPRHEAAEETSPCRTAGSATSSAQLILQPPGVAERRAEVALSGARHAPPLVSVHPLPSPARHAAL